MARPNQTWHKLQDISKWQKEQAQLQLAQALARQEQMEQKLDETKQALEKLDRALTVQQEKGISVAAIRQAGEYAHFLFRRLAENKLALARAKQHVRISQQTVLRHVQEEKKWQLLIDKQTNQLRMEERRWELSEMDEAAVRLYQRSHRLGSEQLERT